MAANFKQAIRSVDQSYARRTSLDILQVNVGNKCNQSCAHCHIGASPQGNRIMHKKTIDKVIEFLSKKKDLVLDITGGCPELNPYFRYFIESAQLHVKQIMVRNNITILFENNMDDLPQFYRQHKVKLICSMPCYTQENVDKQRGQGVFERSIKGLQKLNHFGYGTHEDLQLDLVYNPGGNFLPGDQTNLENDYKKILSDQYGIMFNHLLTITNAPINRFEQYLKANGTYDSYMQLLINNFNKDIAGNVMCRNLLSVGWDGTVYDCDFNLALGLSLSDNQGKSLTIGDLNPDDLNQREIIFENHCFCCTAGSGSSCGGALTT